MTCFILLALDELTGLACVALVKHLSDDFGRLVSLNLFKLSASDDSTEKCLVLFVSARLGLLNEGFNNATCAAKEILIQKKLQPLTLEL